MLTVVELQLHHLSPVKIILQPSSFSIWGHLDLIADIWIILLFMNRGFKILQGSLRALMKLSGLQFFLLILLQKLEMKDTFK